MTHDELHSILQALDLEFDNEPRLIYLFYETPDGRVNNYSISVQCARSRGERPMTDRQLARLMEHEQPDSRGGRLLAVERPDSLRRWIDTTEVCQILHTTPRTLYRWRVAGLLHPSFMAGRNYYDANEVDNLLKSNVIQENGRIDKKGIKEAT